MSLFDYFENSPAAPAPTTQPTLTPSPSLPHSLHIDPADQFIPHSLAAKPHSRSTTAIHNVQLGPSSIFSIEKVQFQFPGKILSLDVKNNVLIMGLESLKVLRINLHAENVIEDIELPRTKSSQGQGSDQNQISKVFVDPTGKHLIVTTSNGDNYYVLAGWKKGKLLSKLKNTVITSAAFPPSPYPNSTGPILLGTTTGLIYETEIQPTTTETSSSSFLRRNLPQSDDTKYLRLVFSLPPTTPVTRQPSSQSSSTERDRAIMDILIEQFPATPGKFVIFVTTRTRFYQFIGASTTGVALSTGVTNSGLVGGDPAFYESIFAQYATGEEGFVEMYHNMRKSSLASLRTVYKNDQVGASRRLAWLMGSGIYRSSISYGSQTAYSSVLTSPKLLSYPSSSNPSPPPISATPFEADGANSEYPIDFGMTEFHYLLVYGDKIKAVWALEEESRSGEGAAVKKDDVLECVWEGVVPLNPTEKISGFIVDHLKSTYWVYTTQNIYELVITDEDRNVWSWYLGHNKFELAMNYAKLPAQKVKITTTQAYHYFNQNRFVLSASFFAKSNVPFETVCLKFMEKMEDEALRVYLTLCLEKVFKKGDSIQTTMIATWLLEILLDKLNKMEEVLENMTSEVMIPNKNSVNKSKENMNDGKQARNGKIDNGRSNSDKAVKEEELKLLKDEVKAFLKTYQGYLDRKTTFSLFTSYSRIEEYLYFALLISDFDKVVSHYINEKKWKEAVEMLMRQPSAELYYRYSPTLMEQVPVELVNAWMRSSQVKLNPRELIPSLLKYNERRNPDGVKENQAIRYLEYTINHQDNTDPAIHNYLLNLYAKQPGDDESSLLRFLNVDGPQRYYGLEYALRLCLQYNKTQSCVHLYGAMGMYEEAVELALKHDDLELAKINADKPEDDESLRKKLWLKIARYVVEQQKDIRKAMEFLQYSDVIKIEDILPFFPDFVHIDDFKDEILAVLAQYNVDIQSLKNDMDEATKSSELIRNDIKQLSTRYIVVSPLDKCVECKQIVGVGMMGIGGRGFYAFPCGHLFHGECLVKRIQPVLPPRQRKRLQDIQNQLSRDLAKSKETTSTRFDSLFKSPLSSSPSSHSYLSGGGLTVPGAQGKTASDASSSVGVNSRIERLKEELDDMIASECSYCGDIMIKSIDAPFVGTIAGISREEIDSWRV